MLRKGKRDKTGKFGATAAGSAIKIFTENMDENRSFLASVFGFVHSLAAGQLKSTGCPNYRSSKKRLPSKTALTGAVL